ncbi:MAG: DUF2927 domain-containing protein [Rhodobacteraceae bacterium]|nr:DUF2927 domain-containing protein [Paracoccaceae bacterium]
MRHIPLLAVLLAATACAPAPIADVTKAHGLPATSADLTAAPAFVETGLPAGMPVAGGHSDAEMAASFMELSFAMESGRKLPVFSRFEGTVTVALTGQVPQGAAGDLATLVRRLQSEAGIDIRPAQAGEAAAITVEFVPRARLRRAAPDAACFVVPNVTSLDDYTARRGTAATDWSIITQRRVAGIFVPADASPQEVRDCLHEEMAQALGPLNDLYRLSDSVFNDDNFNSVLTPFDMTILRAYYSPALTSGLSKSEVAARVGAVMAGINGGSGMGSADLSPTSPAWKAAIETALGGRGGQAARRAAADRALSIAQAQGWRDGRLAFSHFAVARLYVGSDRARAVREFATAAAIYRSLPGGAIQVAHIDMQLAAIAVATGQPEKAIRFADRAKPVVRRAQNMSLLATLMLIEAEALDALGRTAEADRLRVDSQPAARYGFGAESEIRARRREIAALGGSWTRG